MIRRDRRGMVAAGCHRCGSTGPTRLACAPDSASPAVGAGRPDALFPPPSQLWLTHEARRRPADGMAGFLGIEIDELHRSGSLATTAPVGSPTEAEKLIPAPLGHLDLGMRRGPIVRFAAGRRRRRNGRGSATGLPQRGRDPCPDHRLGGRSRRTGREVWRKEDGRLSGR